LEKPFRRQFVYFLTNSLDIYPECSINTHED
jgi:hypothetical protein